MIQPRTPEKEDWYEDEKEREKARAQSQAMKKELIDLLDLFYKDRKTEPDSVLGFSGVAYGFRLQSNGAEVFKGLDDEDGKEKLEVYRKEMQDFTDFLKKIYPKYAFKRPLT